MIPKILHLFWDNNSMSWLQVLTVKTFHKLNPDWWIKVYKPINIRKNENEWIPKYTGNDCFYEIKQLPYVDVVYTDITDYGINPKLNSIHISDILRYCVLYEEGGIWSDFDVLWLKPIELMYNIVQTKGLVPVKKLGASVCMLNDITGMHTIGVLFARPGHPMYADLIKECKLLQRSINSNNYHQVFGSMIWDRWWPKLNNCLYDYHDLVGFPYKTFYPYSLLKLEDLYKEVKLDLIEEGTMAVHWFNGHVLSKEYINNKDCLSIDCTMTRIIKELNLL
jgi:hypothetical protein